MNSSDNTAIKEEIYTRKFHIIFNLLLKIALALGAVLLLRAGHYQASVETLVILSITFLPQIIDPRFLVKIPQEFESLALLFIYMTLFLGEVLDFYTMYWWWDIVIHAESGFLLGITGFSLVYVLNENSKINLNLTPNFIALFAFIFAMAMGTLWEIFEFFMDSAFGLNMQKSGLVDTMWDLIVDCVGALLISILGRRFLQTEASDSFLEKWIDKFIVKNPRLFRKTN